MKSISIQNFKNIFENHKEKDLIVFDIRSEEEYDDFHIDGIPNVPMELVKKTIDEKNIKDDIYLICLSGGRSKHLCNMLEQMGIHNVISVEGGVKKWMGK